MASCVGCKKRTTSFCYVHKQSICDDCTQLKLIGQSNTNVSCNSICHLGNYFDWLADSDYVFPPKCSFCNRTLQADPNQVIRLVCKDLFHRSCLREHLLSQLHDQHVQTKDLKCTNCSALLIDPSTQPKTRLREAVSGFISTLSSPGSSTRSDLKSSTSGERDEFVMVQSPNVSTSPLKSATSSTSSTTPSSSITSASSSYGAVSRNPIASSEQRHMSESPPAISHDSSTSSSRHSVTSSFIPSPTASSSSLSPDLESQSEDTSKTYKKSTNRFLALRNAGQSTFKRVCRFTPQRIVIGIMMAALVLSIIFYIRFSLNLVAAKDTQQIVKAARFSSSP